MQRPKPFLEREIDELQALLDAVPAPLEPLDVVMLDGYLCGVLLQPERVPVGRWLRHVTDADGRALPASFDATRLRALVERRHAELDHAIARRGWFDPWVFELGDVADAGDAGIDDAAGRDDSPGTGAALADPTDDAGASADANRTSAVDAVYPWVAGFATALELFPALMRTPAGALNEPLALLYRHLDADDLEDADELLAEIDALGPAVDLAEAVEGLVRATLLLADITRPIR